MVKRWIDGNKIAEQEAEVPKESWKYEEIMRQIPNFDKTEGAKKVYSKKQYIILAVKKGYVIYNTELPFEIGHTHVKGFEMCKVIIDNVIKKRRPKTQNIYLLTSHIRISTDDKYKQIIEELIQAKKSKGKQVYRNRSK